MYLHLFMRVGYTAVSRTAFVDRRYSCAVFLLLLAPSWALVSTTRMLNFRKISRPQFMLFSIAVLSVMVGSVPHADAAQKPKKSSGGERLLFEPDVLPIFKAKCANCHNPQAKRPSLIYPQLPLC